MAKTGEVRAALATPRFLDDVRTRAAGQITAAVVGPVVHDEHLALQAGHGEHPACACHALGDSLGLVEGGMTTDTTMSGPPGYGLMQICLVYDCLYPYTVRRSRALVPELSERLAAKRP